MALVVQKYGGSSVADADGIKRVAKRIVATKQAGNQVVSPFYAMHGPVLQSRLVVLEAVKSFVAPERSLTRVSMSEPISFHARVTSPLITIASGARPATTMEIPTPKR